MAKSKGSKVKAFELDPAVVGDTDAHPFTLAPIPGLWQVGKPILPEALGLNLTEMRQLVKRFNLPLVEVDAKETDALTAFPLAPQQIESGPAAVDQPGGTETINVGGTHLSVPKPPQTDLQPQTLQAVATATARAKTAEGDETSFEDAVDELGEQHGTDADTLQAVKQAGEDGHVQAEG